MYVPIHHVLKVLKFVGLAKSIAVSACLVGHLRSIDRDPAEIHAIDSSDWSVFHWRFLRFQLTTERMSDRMNENYEEQVSVKLMGVFHLIASRKR